MLYETLFFAFIFLMLGLMILGLYLKAGIFNMLSAGVAIYLMIGLIDKHVGETNQLIVLALVFFGLASINFYYAFWGRKY